VKFPFPEYKWHEEKKSFLTRRHQIDDPEDSGESIPNPTFIYRLQKLGLDAVPTAELREIGIPFNWVQTLAGLVFPKFEAPGEAENPDLSSKVDEAICQSKVGAFGWEETNLSNICNIRINICKSC